MHSTKRQAAAACLTGIGCAARTGRALKGRQDQLAALAMHSEAQQLPLVADAADVGLPVALPPRHPHITGGAVPHAAAVWQ
jgi:hypothetical protein